MLTYDKLSLQLVTGLDMPTRTTRAQDYHYCSSLGLRGKKIKKMCRNHIRQSTQLVILISLIAVDCRFQNDVFDLVIYLLCFCVKKGGSISS